jgi:hypothetical protein
MRSSCLQIAGVLFAAISLSTSAHTGAQNTAAKDAQTNDVKGMPPRATPNDYQAHAQAGKLTIAAEFMGHSVPKPDGPLSTDEYVVIETGLFGAPGDRVKLSVDDFSLRINGKKNPLPSQPFGFVARSIKDPEWSPPTPPGQKSKGGFSTGGQDANSPPPIVHVPIELQRAMALHLQKSALPDGDRALPVAGLLFFPYRGKTQTIHSLELTYNGPDGKVTFPLRP